MKRELVGTTTFIRAAKKFLKKQPGQVDSLSATLQEMEADVFQTKLRAHKPKGDLEGRWACSAGYDLRIIFSFGVAPGAETIQLLSLGSHDEVY